MLLAGGNGIQPGTGTGSKGAIGGFFGPTSISGSAPARAGGYGGGGAIGYQ